MARYKPLVTNGLGAPHELCSNSSDSPLIWACRPLGTGASLIPHWHAFQPAAAANPASRGAEGEATLKKKQRQKKGLNLKRNLYLYQDMEFGQKRSLRGERRRFPFHLSSPGAPWRWELSKCRNPEISGGSTDKAAEARAFGSSRGVDHPQEDWTKMLFWLAVCSHGELAKTIGKSWRFFGKSREAFPYLKHLMNFEEHRAPPTHPHTLKNNTVAISQDCIKLKTISLLQDFLNFFIYCWWILSWMCDLAVFFAVFSCSASMEFE